MNFSEDFESFFVESESSVRRSLVARYGAELGREAFVVAWNSWDKVRTVESRAGYVYRIGERWAARQSGKPDLAEKLFPVDIIDSYEDIELAKALQQVFGVGLSLIHISEPTRPY